MINVAVLVLVTLRRHVLGLALVGPSFLAVVQIGAVGVQRRLQVGQQGICATFKKCELEIRSNENIITRPNTTTTTALGG